MPGLSINPPFDILQAFTYIHDRLGDQVALDDADLSILKFGRNESIGTSAPETIWQMQDHETFCTTDLIDSVSSSSAADTMEVTIIGHSVQGTGASAQFSITANTVTLNGQTRVALPNTMARAHRMYVTGTDIPAGDLHVYEDTALTGGVPSDLTKAHLKIRAGETQTYKAAYTTSYNEYLLISSLVASVAKKTSAIADIQLQVREPGGAFRPKFEFSVSSAGGVATIDFKPYIIVPKNSDLRVVAVSDTNDTHVNAAWNSYSTVVVA